MLESSPQAITNANRENYFRMLRLHAKPCTVCTDRSNTGEFRTLLEPTASNDTGSVSPTIAKLLKVKMKIKSSSH